MLKRLSKLGLMLLFVLVFTTSIIPAKSVKASPRWLDVSASANTSYQGKLKWKKKSVSYYKIYRATVNETTGETGKLKKIAKISGKKTSFTDKKAKKNKLYYYAVKGYKKGKTKYFGDNYARIGVPITCWEDCFWAEGYISPDRVDIEGYTFSGICPEGYEIYRKAAEAPDTEYAKIATVKGKYSFKYKDTSVEPYGEYSYRARAYRTIKKKRVYGAYSDELIKSAVDMCPSLNVEVITPATTKPVSAIQVKISPKSGSCNGKLYMSRDEANGRYFYTDEAYVSNYDDTMSLKATRYSFDGVTWTDFLDVKDDGYVTKRVCFDGSKPFYLEYVSSEGKSFEYPAKNSGVAEIADLGPRYCSVIPYFMTLNFNTGSAELDYDSEAVH